MLSFRPLLESAGFDPKEVNLLRHCPAGITDPFGAWRADRAAFEAYQSMQARRDRSYFSRPYWAAFAPTRQGRTIFLGIYEAHLLGPVIEGEIDALTGEVLREERADRYDCKLRPDLAE